MRKISLIVLHCSATRVDCDFTAKDVDTAHRYRGFRAGAIIFIYASRARLSRCGMKIRSGLMHVATMRSV